MSSPRWAILAAVAAIALTLVQDVLPGRDAYHGWQYLTLLGLAIAVVLDELRRTWRRRTDLRARRLAPAFVGALAVAAAGFVSGLIGPDTITVTGAPGTTTPVPDLRAAAAFGAADAATIERGDAAVTLRRVGRPPLVVGSRPVPLGLWTVSVASQTAAYVAAQDLAGRRLTVTQPANPAFLSPVLMFRQTQSIRGRTIPFDTFAVPAKNRVVHALAFTHADLAAFGRSVSGDRGGVILSVDDDKGNQHGITLARSGTPVRVDDLQLTVTTGSYPTLIVASAPEPFTIVGGTLLFALGIGWAALGRRLSSPSYSRT